MSNSIANEVEVKKLAKKMTEAIPPFTKGSTSSRDWTHAVWQCFNNIAKEKTWILYPEEKPYKGEFLLDFVLWEKDYGPRIICESQWQHRFGGIDAINWAFDKLRMVKGDIKVLIYEWDDLPVDENIPLTVREILEVYLRDNKLISTDEAFLFLNFSHKKKFAHWWKPIKSGEQNEIVFTKINLD